ncbi:nuclear transport factor 2 family protein [Methylobacterium isbiliense]|uniref:SnoaL-like domain-containing protein n=1 Tax=Methylobacterium isbiliense TaxID=315478 RepID=A0ABQ4SNN6_9HYPH|nr:nuclear transport factor 2 family protein [Methylobacterium isbiliense]MDN3627335.1 nuclear transport factor 2 family protein [Methylobacterium isbiliense]GJE03354.1 hypothetical protein GMJLKIPL_5308 [Methylobacterium isbiliense]
MSQEEANIARLKDAYARWSDQKGADCGCWMNLMADDATLRSLAESAPELPFAAQRRSRQEIQDYLDGLLRDWEMVEADMNDFIAQGDRVVAMGRVAWRNRATGKVAASRKVDIWQFRNGDVVGFEEFFDTAGAVAAATPEAAS